MKVSFDFDDTLVQTRPDEDCFLVEVGPNEALITEMRTLANQGHTLLIVTSRREDREGDSTRTKVATFVADHNLPVAQVVFTEGQPKAPFLTALGVGKHFDDDGDELAALSTSIQGVLVPLHPSWGSTVAPAA